MSDATTIEQAIRAANPSFDVNENGVVRQLSPAEYEAEVARQVKNILAANAQQTDDDAKKQLRRQVRIALTTLNDDLVALENTAQTMTAAQLRAVLAHVTRAGIGMIRTMIDAGVIEVAD